MQQSIQWTRKLLRKPCVAAPMRRRLAIIAKPELPSRRRPYGKRCLCAATGRKRTDGAIAEEHGNKGAGLQPRRRQTDGGVYACSSAWRFREPLWQPQWDSHRETWSTKRFIILGSGVLRSIGIARAGIDVR